MALTDPIIQFQKERASVPFQPPTLCTAETFPLLLAGVPALRKIPGLAALEDAGEAYFTSVPFCLSREDRQAARDHLEQVYGITDKDSMVAFCKEALLTNHEYLDFESFWDGRPSFSLEDLSPGARFSAAVRLCPAVPAPGGPPGLPGLGHQRDTGTSADRLRLRADLHGGVPGDVPILGGTGRRLPQLGGVRRGPGVRGRLLGLPHGR